MQRPLVWTVLFLIPGILWGRLVDSPGSDLLLGIVVAAGICWSCGNTWKVAHRVAWAVAALLLGWHCSERPVRWDKAWIPVTIDEAVEVTLRGRVVEEPLWRVSKRGKDYQVFNVKAESIRTPDGDERQVRGPVRVTFFGVRPDRQASYGDNWIIRGELRRFAADSDLEPDRYILFSAIWKSRRTGRGQGDRFRDFCVRARQSASDLLNGHQDSDAQSVAVMRALVLGYSQEVSRETRDLFAQAGTLHIFAISGLHVGIAAAIFVFLLRWMGVPRQRWGLILGPLLVIYIVMTGAKVSAVRACLMALIFWLGPLLRRKPDSLSSLALAAGLIALIAPEQVVAPGYILSFVIVLGLIVFCPPMYRYLMSYALPDAFLPPERSRTVLFVVWKWVVSSVVVSIVSWVVSTPLIAWYFGLISPVALVSNLVIVPMAFGVVVLGFSALLLGSVWGVLAGFVNLLNLWLIDWMLALTHWFLTLPGAVISVEQFPLWAVWLWYAVLVAGWIALSVKPARRAPTDFVLDSIA